MHKGQIVGGYVLLDRIGEGGMGEVWSARQPGPLERVVVVKGLRQGADSTMRRRFEGEMKNLAACEHPHIVPMISPLIEGEDLYLAMRFIPGPNLGQRLKQLPPLSNDAKVSILTEVLTALVYLHEEADVVHRDLKPANILLDRGGRAFLADFGIAKFQDPDMTQTMGPGWGSRGYVAPEAEWGSASFKSDVWSFGAVALRVFAGAVPDDGIPEGRFAGPLTGEIRSCLGSYRPSSRDLLQAFQRVRHLGFDAATEQDQHLAGAPTTPFTDDQKVQPGTGQEPGPGPEETPEHIAQPEPAIAFAVLPELVSLDTDLGSDSTSVIRRLAELTVTSGRASDLESLIGDALVRESRTSTGLLRGIAIPHCKSRAVLVPTIAIARLPHKVDFGAKDGPSDIIFFIATPLDTGEGDLAFLRSLARAMVLRPFTERLRSAATPEDVVLFIEAVTSDNTVPPNTPSSPAATAEPPMPNTSQKPPAKPAPVPGSGRAMHQANGKEPSSDPFYKWMLLLVVTLAVLLAPPALASLGIITLPKWMTTPVVDLGISGPASPPEFDAEETILTPSAPAPPARSSTAAPAPAGSFIVEAESTATRVDTGEFLVLVNWEKMSATGEAITGTACSTTVVVSGPQESAREYPDCTTDSPAAFFFSAAGSYQVRVTDKATGETGATDVVVSP